MATEQDMRNSFADYLETLAKEIREGKTEVTTYSQEMPLHRFWLNGKWEYFRTRDLKISVSYFNKEQRKEETDKLEKFLADNPRAEDHGWEPRKPFMPVVQTNSSMDWPIAPDDRLLVFLNDELQGMVIEADAEKGFIVKRTFDGDRITLKGKVRIEFNGQEVVRAEAGAPS